jgi:hypothetical protein
MFVQNDSDIPALALVLFSSSERVVTFERARAPLIAAGVWRLAPTVTE